MSEEPWDGGWAIGYDVTAALTRKALDDAGITREMCKTMTERELMRIVGYDGAVRLWSHGLSVEGQRAWNKRFGLPEPESEPEADPEPPSVQRRAKWWRGRRK